MQELGNARTIYVDLKARIGAQVNHVVAAALLIYAAAGSIAAGHHVLWGLFEIAAASALIVMTAKEIRHLRTSPPREELHDHIGWLEIVAGLFLGIEASTKTQGNHHVSFVVLSFVPSLLLIALGLFQSRIGRRFFIRVTEQELIVRMGRRAKFTAAWADIATVQPGGRGVEVRKTDGSVRTIPTSAVWQSDKVRSWILARATERLVTAGDEGSVAVSPVR